MPQTAALLLELAVRIISLIASGAALALLGLALPASSETRQAYLARLQTICEAQCLQPRELLRTARQRRPSERGEMAGIIDIGYVSKRDTKYLLHQQAPNLLDMSELDFGMPQQGQSPIVNLNAIVIEIDEQTVLDLLNTPIAVANPGANPGTGAGADADIVVEGDRERERAKPSLEALEAMFRNRRIVVRGEPRLDVAFVGARRDRRRKMLTLVLDNADNVVLLPRYDSDGNPVLDGPLEGLRAP